MIDKVTDITKVIISDFDVLVKIENKTKSGLITPTGDKSNGFLYATVLVVGKQVDNIKEGDIILDFVRSVGVFDWKNGKYAVSNKNNISIAVSEEYFDNSDVKIDSNITC